MRRFNNLTDEAAREIELAENTERLALNDYDSSKTRLAEIRQAAADLKAEKAVLPKSGKAPSAKHAGGRPPKGEVSRREVAALI